MIKFKKVSSVENSCFTNVWMSRLSKSMIQEISCSTGLKNSFLTISANT
jgi:hypothetical protein